jgi:hypothetical protein
MTPEEFNEKYAIQVTYDCKFWADFREGTGKFSRYSLDRASNRHEIIKAWNVYELGESKLALGFDTRFLFSVYPGEIDDFCKFLEKHPADIRVGIGWAK